MVSEIVLIDLNDNLARAQAEDIRFVPGYESWLGILRSRGLLAPQEGYQALTKRVAVIQSAAAGAE